MRSGNFARGQAGFTYIAMLIAVAVIGVGLAAASAVWSQSRQREREQELLFIGHQFRQAIALYYEHTPGAVKHYPQKLEDLVKDARYLTTQRYLRKLFVDPMTGRANWGKVPAPGGGIMGVYSLSKHKPLKTSGFSEEDRMFEGATGYAQWLFVYQPVATPALAPTATPRGLPVPGNLSGPAGAPLKAQPPAVSSPRARLPGGQ